MVDALPGTVWDGPGGQRQITRIEGAYCPDGRTWFGGNVYWCRPGGKEQSSPQWGPYFSEWIRKARPANAQAQVWLELHSAKGGAE